MATHARICSSCKIKLSNPGHKWCDDCYNNSKFRPRPTHCKNCGQPPNPGFDLCEYCYHKAIETNTPLKIFCIMCNKSWAEPNVDLCKHCMDSLNKAGTPLQRLCNVCNVNVANPGFPMCEDCYNLKQLQRINAHQLYANGYASMQIPFPIPPCNIPAYFQQLTPMTYNSQIYQNSEDTATPGIDVKSLLDMGSTQVNTKEKACRPSSAEASDYHCICPQCYSDTSRNDLFYCVHCFDNVVEGQDICRDCRMKMK